jgi:hypothetical protein
VLNRCSGSSYTLAQVKAACYQNALLRCQQGQAGRTGGSCVGVGAEGTCDKKALTICGCDPVRNPQCRGEWKPKAALPDTLTAPRARLASFEPSTWTCGAPIADRLLASMKQYFRFLISPADLGAVLVRGFP